MFHLRKLSLSGFEYVTDQWGAQMSAQREGSKGQTQDCNEPQLLRKSSLPPSSFISYNQCGKHPLSPAQVWYF